MGEGKEQHLLFTAIMMGTSLFNFLSSCQTDCDPDKLLFCLVPFSFQYFALSYWLQRSPTFRATLLQRKEQPKIMAALLPLLCLGLDVFIVFNMASDPMPLLCIALLLLAIGLWQEWKNGFLLGRRLPSYQRSNS